MKTDITSKAAESRFSRFCMYNQYAADKASSNGKRAANPRQPNS